VTLEGLGSRDHPDPLQQAFITKQAAQCGYCLNGMIMTAKVLLKHTPHPSETDVLEALRYNLCRCGAHIEILRAVMRAAGDIAALGQIVAEELDVFFARVMVVLGEISRVPNQGPTIARETI
jgi:xanthine dehydrogenase iron-sulfur cluster and FAD-binding subunit A